MMKIDSSVDVDFAFSRDLVNSWVKGPLGELVFWVPGHHRRRLYRPFNTCITGNGATRIDLSKFVHGNSWQQCRDVAVLART